MRRSPSAVLSEGEAWEFIDHERLVLADLLDGLSDDEWEQASLCAGWTVRDVAAHLALAHMGAARAVAELTRAAGRFDVMVRDSARRHARTPQPQLVGEIRAMVGSRRLAPGVTSMEPLLDVLVHAQDVSQPLQRPHRMPPDAAVAAADRVWTYGWPLSTVFRARTRLQGFELVATNAAWSVGHGARVEGPIDALLLLLTGRTALLDRLSGPGVAQLRRSLQRRDARAPSGTSSP